MNCAYIALGSNIESRESFLQEAIYRLNTTEGVQVVEQSNIYETEPVGLVEQASFLNMVIKVKTSLKPIPLLAECQKIEVVLGRKRTLKWGPRTIDLDILLYNQESIDTEQLIVPHPSMVERAFVLIPLADINDSIQIGGKAISGYINRLPEEEREGVTRWSKKDGQDVFEHFES